MLRGPFARLSKGQLQRVVLLEALSAPVGLLILDEPWDGLDGDGRELLARALSDRAARGSAVVLTDHTGAGAGLLDVHASLLIADGRAHLELGKPPATDARRVAIARDPHTGRLARHEVMGMSRTIC